MVSTIYGAMALWDASVDFCILSAAFYVTSGCTHLSAASPSLSWFTILLSERSCIFFFLYELSGIHFKGLLVLMEFTCFGTSLRQGMILRCFLHFMVYRSYSLICFLCKLAVARFAPVSACSCTSSEVWGCSDPHLCRRWLESKACFKRSPAKFPKMCEFWKLCRNASRRLVLCQ